MDHETFYGRASRKLSAFDCQVRLIKIEIKTNKNLDINFFNKNCKYLISFQDESSVQALIDACIQDDDKLYLCVSSPTIKDKPVQIRPWRLSDADFVLDASLPLDPRKTVFVGGVPRPLKAGELFVFQPAAFQVL